MRRFLIHITLITATIPLWWVSAFLIYPSLFGGYNFNEIEIRDVLIGDSHAQNLVWQNGDTFILPGSGLFHSYLVIRELSMANKNNLDGFNIYMTIWPGSFSGIQEGRFNGEFKDDWISNIGARCAMLLHFDDWVNPNIPLHMKIELLKGTLHFDFRSTHAYENKCTSSDTFDPEKFKILSEHFTSLAFENAKFSKWCFKQIQEIAIASNAQLVWLETPIHESFFSQIDFIEDYNEFMKNNEDTQIKRLDAIHFHNDKTVGFNDYHHFNCNIAEPLDSLIIAPFRHKQSQQ